ncbi:hypothetical protein OsI_36820 [Oryza sativa Indica Group]|uniref:Remorin C-terminal domain-containing protein n=1 Tax=Oryza sativa subsp. indica TaxID=39946 RepID=A2ZGB6_ORYSI|nr:hypothetical protein OsI_36820 [Oryza sativa Indica Group]
MEPKSSSSSHYLQPSATLPSTRRNSFQGVGAEAGGGGGGMNPFGPTFSDPLCSLNLKETSEFVRSSFPMATMARSNSSNGATGNGGHGYHRETSTASSSSSSSASAQRRRAEQQQQQVPATPGRPLLFFNSSSPAHHQLVSARRSVPSKWEDAEKWVRQASSDHHGGHHHHHGKGSKLQEEKRASAVRRSVDADVTALALYTAPAAEVFLKDKFTDNVEPSKESFVFRSSYCEPTKNTAAQAVAAGNGIDHRRDIGTEMTPLGSSTTSRCHTPIKSTSPARHNTPASRSGPLVPYAGGGGGAGQDISDLADCHFAKLDLGAQFDAMLINWSSKEEEEEEREEAKIQAWINLESAKAEAQSRKLEVKIQKMRSNLEEKLMRRMTTVHRRAEEWRATAQAQHLQQLKRAAEQVRRAKATSHHHHHHHLAGSNASCGCFPCNGSNNIISGNLLNYY